jgi:peptidoglycan-associated lipoprotein
MKHLLLYPSLLALALAASGCDDPKPPRHPAAGGDHGHGEPNGAGQRTDPRKGGADVEIDRRLAELCDIPTAYFGYDEANVSTQARNALDALASCLKDGKGKGHSLRLVGHADPRGTTDYNFGLGQRRAGSVALYVIRRGVSEERVESSSRGELDARGGDEQGWRDDRRVEILLADD